MKTYSDNLVLEGRADEPRLFTTKGGYRAAALTLSIGDIQSWRCVAFGAAMRQVERLTPHMRQGQWIRVQAHATDVNDGQGWGVGLRVEKIAPSAPPRPVEAIVTVQEAFAARAGRPAGLEVLTQDGVSAVLEIRDRSRAAEILDRFARPGQRVRAVWRDLRITIHLHGRHLPIMTSELVCAEAA